MTQQMPSEMDSTSVLSRMHCRQALEDPQEEGMGQIMAIMMDAVIHVSALMDAVCCRMGEWVDRQHYKPHPVSPEGGLDDRAPIVRLALACGGRGLADGGYIELRLVPEDEVIETDGGYYDENHRPHEVARRSLHWREIDYQSLGQTLLLMYDRIVQTCTACEMPGEELSPERDSAEEDDDRSSRHSPGRLGGLISGRGG